jgi:alkyldihydroxyacetonephosphate synthase
LIPKTSENQQKKIRDELSKIVGEENVSIRKNDLISYSVDNFWVPRHWINSGRWPYQADCIVYPSSAEEVSKILVFANENNVPVVTWGGGAGSQGGALAIKGGIILDMKRMNRVIDISETSLTVTAQTGIIHQDLEWALNRKGLSMMHYPASISCSTLGGFLAHRGSGVLSTKYGKIEEMILSMEVVLPTGEIIHTLSNPRHAAGPDLNQVFMGSEGTFGVMTEATLVIHKVPEVRRFRSFLFRDLRDGLEAGARIMRSRAIPSVIRLYDEAETKTQVKRVLGIDREGSYLVLGYEGYDEIVKVEELIGYRICEELGGEDLGMEAGQRWWDHRYKFFFPPYCLDLPRLFGTMDTVATFDRIADVYYGMKNAIEENFPGTTFIGHFSHWYPWGAMLYDRFIVDNPPDDPDEALALHNKIWDTGVRAALSNGGIINEHHGIGLKLSRFMREQYGPAFKILEVLKKGLDPNGIMNPGKLGFGDFQWK